MESSMEVLPKIKNPISGYVSKGNEIIITLYTHTYTHTHTHLYFHVNGCIKYGNALSTANIWNSQAMETLYLSKDEEYKKMW